MDFDAVDANRDGVIDRAEWNAAAAVSGSRLPLLSMDSSLMLSEVGPASPTGPTSPQAIRKALELAQSRHQELEDLLEATNDWHARSAEVHQAVVGLEEAKSAAELRLDGLQYTLQHEREALAQVVNAARKLREERDGALQQVQVLSDRVGILHEGRQHEREQHAREEKELQNRVLEMEAANAALRQNSATQQHQSAGGIEAQLAAEHTRCQELLRELEQCVCDKLAAEQKVADLTTQATGRHSELTAALDRDRHQMSKMDAVLQEERAGHEAKLDSLRVEIGLLRKVAIQQQHSWHELTYDEQQQQLATKLQEAQHKAEFSNQKCKHAEHQLQHQTSQVSVLQGQLASLSHSLSQSQAEHSQQHSHTKLLARRCSWLQRSMVGYITQIIRRDTLRFGFSKWASVMKVEKHIAIQKHIASVDDTWQANLEPLSVQALDVHSIALAEFGLGIGSP